MKTSLTASLAPTIEQVELELAKLQPRERLLVAVGAVALALTLLYLALWRPAAHARLAAEQRLDQAHDVAAQLERAGALVPHGPATATANYGSLLATVDAASKAGDLGKPLTRLSPDGDTQVRAWVEDVPFDALTHWIFDLQNRYGVRVDSIDIEQQPTPGLVNARLTLVKAS